MTSTQVAEQNIAQADEMARIASHMFPFMGVVADHIAAHMPKDGSDLKPGDDPVALALAHARDNRSYLAYCYAVRSLNLLRSIALLYHHALPDGVHAIARTCLEHEAAALVVAYGTDDDLNGIIESSQAWQQAHAKYAGEELTEAPFPAAPDPKPWAPRTLMNRMRVAAGANSEQYSQVRCGDLRFYHGYLSYLEGHADFRLAVLAVTRIDGVPLAGFEADPFVANAAVTATAWAASIAACSLGVSDADLKLAVAAFEEAVPIPHHPA